MAESLAAVFVLSALGRGEDEAAVLDGPGALQHMPMRLAGLARESSRHRKEGRAGFRQATVEGGEAEVIADGQAEPAPRQVGDDAVVSGAIVARLAVALAAGEIDIKHMDLVVARDDLAFRIDEEGTVDRLFR